MRYIIDDMMVKDKKQYKIRWEGFNEEWDTWEQEENIGDKELIIEYENDRENQEDDRNYTRQTIIDT